MDYNNPLIVRISESINEIEQAEWESIFPVTPESYYFFKTIEETLQNQFKFLYITMYENSQIICVAPCFIMNYDLETTVEGYFKRIILRLKKLVPHLFTLKILVCGCPPAEGKIGLKNYNRPDITKILVETLFGIAKEESCRLIAFKDFSLEYKEFFENVEKMGFHKMPSYPSVELDIRFKSFQEYLASLSRVTRKGLNRKFRQLESLPKVELEIRSKTEDLIDRIYQLYLDNLKRSQVQFERLTRDFFRRISENMPKETKYFLWWINGRLVAFDLCLVQKDILVDEYIGMDYEVAYKYHLYYITFRDIMNWCIENGIRTYESGAFNYDPKKRLDFKFIHQFIYFKHCNSLMNLLFGFLCIAIKPENFDPVLKSLRNKKQDAKR